MTSATPVSRLPVASLIGRFVAFDALTTRELHALLQLHREKDKRNKGAIDDHEFQG
jgi:hypothetical protein